MNQILEKTKIVKIKAGSTISWREYFENKITKDANKIEIHDNYLRKNHQFHSLENFLLFVNKECKKFDTKIIVSVSTKKDEDWNISNEQIKLLNSFQKKITAWLDKGFDIINRNGFTYESYIFFES